MCLINQYVFCCYCCILYFIKNVVLAIIFTLYFEPNSVRGMNYFGHNCCLLFLCECCCDVYEADTDLDKQVHGSITYLIKMTITIKMCYYRKLKHDRYCSNKYEQFSILSVNFPQLFHALKGAYLLGIF